MGKWTAERWSEISPYLDQALELGADERQRWLRELTAARPAIAADIISLLARHETNGLGQFLEHSPLEALADPQEGDRVGAYTLKRSLGRGGMGTVWLADRSDGRFEGQAAIKILKRSRFAPDASAQIRREASLLARLSHPNIAHLLDAGIREDGRPFLILEYIEGERIDEHCSRNKIAVLERLRLFLTVLKAVGHAHAHGIIHRDIKPSNILVTPLKIPKLLDFGVASLQPAINKDPSSAALPQEPAAMTPGYAPQEQIRGEQTTAATDVYALGILLYVLMTDRHPHGTAELSTPTQMVHATLIRNWPRPSESIGTVGLNRRAREDLDAIIAKATNPEAQARYASASQFAQDIQRLLDGLPVQARPATPEYRAALFWRRLAGMQPGATQSQRRKRSGALLMGAVLIGTVSLVLVGALAGKAPWNSTVPVRSIAVLPFNDFSDAKDAEYFSDGLSEELIDRLTHLTNLTVIARNSSFRFKGAHEDPRSIARTLGVTHLLEGSVRKSGALLRISVQLIRVADGVQVWSQTYDRNLDDVFKVQTDIADSVAEALSATLRTDPSQHGPPTVNVDAYNLVLQGNFFKARADRIDVERAISLYKQAIALDPHYALPWALLGDAYFVQISGGWIAQEDGIRLARAALSRSIEMDPKLIWPHYTLSNLDANFDFDWSAAYAEIERMRQIDAGDTPLVLGATADLEADFGRLDRAIELYKAALRSDPLNTVDLAGLAYSQFAKGNDDAAIAAIRRLLELAPQFTGAQAQLAIYLLHSGKVADAFAAARQESDDGIRLFALSILYWGSGQRETSDATLSQLEQEHGAADAYAIACVRAYRGETDSAIQWLERAQRQRDAGLALIKIDPLLSNIHGDHRYRALLRDLKLTPEAG